VAPQECPLLALTVVFELTHAEGGAIRTLLGDVLPALLDAMLRSRVGKLRLWGFRRAGRPADREDEAHESSRTYHSNSRKQLTLA